MERGVYALPNYNAPIPLVFDENLCNGCNHCVEVCQMDVLIPNSEKGRPPVILHPDECWYCGCCVNDCPRPGAVVIKWPLQQRTYWKDLWTGKVFRDTS